jgi:hypothetical protein
MKKVIICLSVLLGWSVSLFATDLNILLTCPDGSALTKGMSVAQVRDQCNNHAYLTAQPTQTSWTDQTTYRSKHETTTYRYLFPKHAKILSKENALHQQSTVHSMTDLENLKSVSLSTKQGYLIKIMVGQSLKKELPMCGANLYLGMAAKTIHTLCGGTNDIDTFTSQTTTSQKHTLLTINISKDKIVTYMFTDDKLTNMKK